MDGDVFGDRAEAGDRGVAAHVADDDAAHVRRHAQFVGEQDVQARGHVAGAGHDGEQAEVGGGEAG